jgi:hypothetical protein
MNLLFTYFIAVRVIWMGFTFGARELRGGILIMPETHIVMFSDFLPRSFSRALPRTSSRSLPQFM